MEIGDMISVARESYARKHPFVLYGFPNQQRLNGRFQVNSHTYPFAADSAGFVMHPFDKGVAYLIPDEACRKESAALKPADLAVDPDQALHSSDQENGFTTLVARAIAEIRKGDMEKVVLSRVEEVKTTKDPFVIFLDLLALHPGAFRFLWFHPETGIWMGATPEVLLKLKQLRFTTMALAGTRSAASTGEWGVKEKSEQEFVTNYIAGQLKPLCDELIISEPVTAVAGPVEHIRSEISGQLRQSFTVTDILEKLHPTPAVCGMPKECALKFIQENEGYDRGYYTGFLGEISAEECSLFVNLRSMQMQEDKARIYVGCGITADSDPKLEFLETVNKSLTMKRVLNR
jgi:isochorismate synthase